MSAKVLVFVICIEAIIYLLLYNLHDCTFNFESLSTIFCPRLYYLTLATPAFSKAIPNNGY